MTTKALYPSTLPSLSLDFSNTKALDPRITFARASTGRFYDGKTVAKAEENLLIRSQEFNVAPWDSSRVTLGTNSDVSPDGTTTAESVTQSTGQTTAGWVRQSVTVASGAVTISVFAKPNGKNFLIINEGLGTGSGRNTWFNVATGAVGTSDAGHTASISASANGYYRCTITLTANAARTSTVLLYCADTDNSFTVTDSGGIFLWGAQLEQRSAVTAYTPTTTQPITNYIPVLQTAANGVARFDHNPVTGESLGLLIEEQRTNLLTRSEEFNDSGWGKTGATVTANTVVAPDGALSADVLVENTANSAHGVFRAATTVSSTVYTGSVYVKAGGRGFCLVYTNAGAVGKYFSLPSGGGGAVLGNFGAGPTSASITYVGNDWYRCSITFTSTGTSTTLEVLSSSAGNNLTYTGDGYSGVYIWGAQLEAGAFPTSYIPTVASQVTRSADAASMTGTNFSSWYRADEGTLYADFSLIGVASGAAQTSWSVSANNTTDFITNRTLNNAGLYTVRVANVNQADLSIASGTALPGASIKQACAYKVNDFAVANSGSASVSTDTQGTVPVVSQALIGATGTTNVNALNGTIKKLAYYPRRLSNAQLQALTQN